MRKKKNAMLSSLTDKYDIQIGDRFYLNSHAVRQGMDLPDYQIVTWVKGEFFGAKYENCGIGNLERIMGINVLNDSNLNRNATKPSWVFLKRA